MINLTREEAQQVLDALEDVTDGAEEPHKTKEAIETLRARLSAPEPEPVAYLVYDRGASSQHLAFDDELGDMDGCDIEPLYTAPPQTTCPNCEYNKARAKLWRDKAYELGGTPLPRGVEEWVGLTEKETIDLALNAFALPEFSLETRQKMQNELVKAMNEPDSRLMIFAASIEAKLKEKNI